MALFIPNRNSGLEVLNDFVPRAGAEYARTRNFDFGPENRANISQLSPFIRHRLLSETEVLKAVLGAHSLDSAEKFVQEVCWRTYWKGWLELRPQVWTDYVEDVKTSHARLSDRKLGAYEAAVSGSSGIDCFDFWAQELMTTGYLHNHARMWFASIWVFTLRLPWSLGADFFMQNLLDADAASNTLSWRWVAGLQTLGKTYLARSDNIAKFTAGRFQETPGLAASAPDLGSPEVPKKRSLPVLHPADASKVEYTGLVVTDDDLTPRFVSRLPPTRHVLVLDTTQLRTHSGTSPVVAGFVDGALTDFEQRTAVHTTRVSLTRDGTGAADVCSWCAKHDVRQLVAACVPVGPNRDALKLVRIAAGQQGVSWAEARRQWDELAWPLATKGFFNFKKNISGLLARQGIVKARS